VGRTSREIQLVEYPQGDVRASHFRVVAAQLPDPGPGEVLVRNTFTSVDPGMRLRLRANAPLGYFQSFPLRAPMDGIMTVGGVVESRAICTASPT
jgi:NADPH-dependent curcumin reductase CurA